MGSAPDRRAVAFINVWDSSRTDNFMACPDYADATRLRGASAGAVILLVGRRESEAS
jgi:hypothetical protein